MTAAAAAAAATTNIDVTQILLALIALGGVYLGKRVHQIRVLVNSQLDRVMKQLAAAIVERDTARATVAERDTAIGDRDAAIGVRDAAAHATVAERDTAIGDRDTAIGDRDTAIGERDATISERFNDKTAGP